MRTTGARLSADDVPRRVSVWTGILGVPGGQGAPEAGGPGLRSGAKGQGVVTQHGTGIVADLALPDEGGA